MSITWSVLWLPITRGQVLQGWVASAWEGPVLLMSHPYSILCDLLTRPQPCPLFLLKGHFEAPRLSWRQEGNDKHTTLPIWFSTSSHCAIVCQRLCGTSHPLPLCPVMNTLLLPFNWGHCGQKIQLIFKWSCGYTYIIDPASLWPPGHIVFGAEL